MIKKITLLIAILIIASFLRLYNFIPLEIRSAEGTAAAARGGLSLTGLTSLPPGLYPDEAMNGNNATEAWENRDWKVFYPENFGREGLFINLQSLSVAAFGNKPWALRLPSAIFGILTVLGLYFFTKELFSNYQIALLSSFLLATSFWHINFSRVGFRAIMAPFFLTWSLYFLLLSIRKVNLSHVTSHMSLVAAAIGGLLYGLGFYSYIAYRATPLLVLFIFYYFYKYFYKNSHPYKLENVRMIFLVFISATIVSTVPLGIYFLQNPQDFFGRTAGISIFNSETPLRDFGLNILKTAGMFNVVGDFNWRHNIAGRPLLFWPVGIFFLIGIIYSLKMIFKNSKHEARNPKQYLNSNDQNNKSFEFNNLNLFRDSDFGFRILIAWFLVALAPVAISNEGLPHALRSILAVPPVFILAALGGLKIYEILKSKLTNRVSLVTCCLFLSLLLFESYYTYFITWGQNPNVKPAFAYNDYVIAQYLNSLPKETPKYVVVSDYNGKIERDNPISLQSILFLTDTFTDKKQRERNLFYITKNQYQNLKIPQNAVAIDILR